MPEYFNNMVKVLQYRENEEEILCKELANHFSQSIDSFHESDTLNGDLSKALSYGIKKIEKLVLKKQRYLGPNPDSMKSTSGDE